MKLKSSYLKRLSLLSMLFLGICSMTIAQRTITGVITDADTGEGLIGANILAVGTDAGASTDIDGSYSLDVPAGVTQLEITYTGYADQLIDLGAENVINVAMTVGSFLEEVVVTGYGTQKSKNVTTAISSIDQEDFNKGLINDATQALQGKIPGLQIYNKGGDPNSNPVIRLRGISTVGANAQPLVVIDGVIGADINNVDPNDIENISVLKDGSAAAIYGSRGSAGVILVTTKTGKRGAGLTAEYSGNISSASVARNIDVMTPAEFTTNGGNDLGSSTDWQEEVTRNAISHVHNIAVSGGSDNTTFRISTNFRNVEGVLQNSEFDQINARANINHYALNDKLNLNFNMSLSSREQSFSFNEALRYAALFNPTAPIKFDNGEFFQAILFDNFNPVAIIEQNQNLGKRRILNFNAQASYEITDGFNWKVNYGSQTTNNLNGEFYPSSSFFRGLNRGGLANRSANDAISTTFETYGNYDADLGGNTGLTITAGYSFQETDFESFGLSAGNFPSDALGFNALEIAGDLLSGSASGLSIFSDASPNERIIAFFGRVALNLDDGLNISASLRREGSSRFGTGNQWGTFPAVSVSADLNRYLNVGMDALKLRAGYGVTGAQPPGAGFSQQQYNYSFNGGGTVSASNLIANPDLKWEEKGEFNVGLDFAMGDYKLTGTLDFYNRVIKDFIQVVPAPGTNTSEVLWGNAGQISSNGLELSLTYNGIGSGDFSWTPTLVLSTYKSTLDEFTFENATSRSNLGSPGQNGTPLIRVAIGEELGQIWAPVFAGADSEGRVTFQDVNGDGSIVADAGSALAENADYVVAGNGLPDLEIGFTNAFEFGNFDLTAFFRGAFGHSLVNTFRAFYEPIDPGAINSYNRVLSDKAVAGLTEAKFSDLYVEKADFLRLDNLTLGYNFDAGSSTFSNIRAFINVQNVFTITGYTGVDPTPQLQDAGDASNGALPSNFFNPDILSPGIDRRNNYFTARTFTFGLNLGF